MPTHFLDVRLENYDKIARAFDRAPLDMRNGVQNGMVKGGRRMNKIIREEAPEDLGLLRACIGEFDMSYFKGGISMVMGSTAGKIPTRFPRPANMARPKKSWAIFRFNIKDLSLTIGTNVPYARWVNDGVSVSGPIMPKRARYLRFVLNGTVFYRRSVRGHTIPATFFFEKGIKKSQGKFQAELNKEIEKALHSIVRFQRVRLNV